MTKLNDLKNVLRQQLTKIKAEITAKDAINLKLDLVEKIVPRLAFLAQECQLCQDFLLALETVLEDGLAAVRLRDRRGLKQYHSSLNNITAHLRQKHRLVTEGYYSEIYMPLGLALGLPLGVALAHNLGLGFMAIGLPLGLGLGLSMGAGFDAKAKKEGRVI